jgi:hypothetical protein
MANPPDIDDELECLRVMVANTRKNRQAEPREHGAGSGPMKRAQNPPRLPWDPQRRDGSEPEAEA